MEAAVRIAQLRTEIERHAHAYYVLDAPTIPDAEYDKFRVIQDLNYESDFDRVVKSLKTNGEKKS